ISDASSTVTYASVYTDSEPWRYYGEDSAETGPPRVIVYGYDGLAIQPVAPPSPDYEPFEENDEEEEEHPTLADSHVVPTVDLALSAKKAEALEPDEPIHAPGS
nr:hypothetical protein [Tanacetum cinerariifolium]